MRTLGLAALVSSVVLAGCANASPKHNALPPVNASPEQVIAAYVAALNAHDLHAARAFLTPANASLTRFRNLRRITDLHMSAFVDRLDARMLHYRFCVRVEFLNTGPPGLAFLLVRNSRSERWRIGTQGTA